VIFTSATFVTVVYSALPVYLCPSVCSLFVGRCSLNLEMHRLWKRQKFAKFCKLRVRVSGPELGQSWKMDHC